MTCFSAERDMKVNSGQNVPSVCSAAKVGPYRHFALLMLLLLASPALMAQYLLQIKPADTDSNAIAALQLNGSFKNREDCIRFIRKLPETLAAKGFATASVDSILTDSSQTTIHLFLGEKYQWNSIHVTGITEPELQAAGIRLPKKSQPFKAPLVEQIQQQLLDHLSDNGFPFATVQLDSIVLMNGAEGGPVSENLIRKGSGNSNHQISGVLVVNKGLAYKVDSLVVKGSATISENFLQRYLDLPRGSNYNRNRFENISLRLRELPFLQESQPWQLRFGGNGAILDLFLEPKKSSQVNVLVGLLPGTNADGSNKFQVTGEANLNLRNALGNGETIGLNWQQLQVKSPRLNLLFEQPYLFGSAFGISTRFDLFKKDSSFLNLNMQLGLQYAVTSRQTGKIFLQLLRTNLIDIDTQRIRQTRRLPADADRSILNLGVDYETSTTNYRRNPTSGWELFSSISAGTRTIRRSNAVLDLKDPAFNFASLYDTIKLKSYQFKLQGRVARFLRLGRQSTLQLLASAGLLESPTLFRNELFQIGGYKLMRGFDEESIFASRYLVNSIEYRYLVGMNSYFFGFADLGFTGTKANSAVSTGTPGSPTTPGSVQFSARERFIGTGIGMAFETTAGFFNLSLAVGKRGSENFAFRQSKIHLGYLSYF
ncbi:BamA/TamA family outer membrane protein [Flavihumibacter sp. ZG627]|uniref:BamA/TamA family outer membrane protein n=1 Tax=Flavihumibacter sp. ZG627 TaxID=1463156 RepID=UPI00209F1559|nr:BamA/TamA family outer membrane protein [Flavihumibacter sp. ZG627]